MRPRRPDAASERRLEELRREAESRGEVGAPGVRPSGSPLPEASAGSGYYGLPLLKPPVWTWEVPLYFFTGGAAGGAACIAFAARVTGAPERLVRDAQWVAAIGGAVSGPLLIADLGRPERFLNMLRVFKWQSPMSVGAWLLLSFGVAASAAVATRGAPRDLASGVAALAGLGMATYSGVLLGATALPVWSKHASILPPHFAASALGSAASILELLGHRGRALHKLALVAAASETVLHSLLQVSATTRLAGAFSGPIPLLLRALYGRSRRARTAAAASALLGSLLTRFAWVEAGRGSVASPPRPLRGDAARSGDAVR
ncbi:MAG TPA: NrfD/PsrC family molybdoenzyme membrane anchor subunit [Thermoanaerobaculia bacterium]|nr:NrfD/PsrC family molybdoenzyme membrane anchor subunit [Thermoanaerobaculia bacterium]